MFRVIINIDEFFIHVPNTVILGECRGLYIVYIYMISPRLLCRPTAFFRPAGAALDVRELYIRKTADVPLQL